jgi:hypothetical protein
MTHCTRSHLYPVIDVGDFHKELSHLTKFDLSYFRVQAYELGKDPYRYPADSAAIEW